MTQPKEQDPGRNEESKNERRDHGPYHLLPCILTGESGGELHHLLDEDRHREHEGQNEVRHLPDRPEMSHGDIGEAEHAGQIGPLSGEAPQRHPERDGEA